jgi:hypothetical protein
MHRLFFEIVDLLYEHCKHREGCEHLTLLCSYNKFNAGVLESVDKSVLDAEDCNSRGGSSPFARTIFKKKFILKWRNDRRTRLLPEHPRVCRFESYLESQLLFYIVNF